MWKHQNNVNGKHVNSEHVIAGWVIVQDKSYVLNAYGHIVAWESSTSLCVTKTQPKSLSLNVKIQRKYQHYLTETKPGQTKKCNGGFKDDKTGWNLAWIKS